MQVHVKITFMGRRVSLLLSSHNFDTNAIQREFSFRYVQSSSLFQKRLALISSNTPFRQSRIHLGSNNIIRKDKLLELN